MEYITEVKETREPITPLRTAIHRDIVCTCGYVCQIAGSKSFAEESAERHRRGHREETVDELFDRLEG